MRGTSSHDVDFDDVFVPDERVLADRPYGEIDAPLQVISSIGFVVISAVYLGIAEGAYAHAVASLADKQVSTIVQRQVGLMTHRLADRRLGPRGRARRPSATTRRRRWTPSPP